MDASWRWACGRRGIVLWPLATLLPWLPAPARSAGGQRIALLIGNAAYQNEKPLRNPSNDVDLLARVLKNDLRFN